MRIAVMHPKELTADDMARWNALRGLNPELASPYFSPRFARCVGAVRDDARIARFEDAGETVGFLPAQRSSGFAAMPLGAPLSDYQGLIGPATLPVDSKALCRALKVGRLDFSAAISGQSLFDAGAQGGCESFVARLPSGGADAYRAILMEARKDTIKKMNRKRAAMARDLGQIQFTAGDASKRRFEQLLIWNRAKCRRSRQPPIWETRWVLDTLEAIGAEKTADFRPLLFTDSVDGRLAAAQLCLQSNDTLHVWMIGHDPALDAYSPGFGLARAVIEWAADQGFAEVDLGLGDYRFKRQLTNAVRPISYGFLGYNSWSAAVRGAAYAVRGRLETAPAGPLSSLPGRAMRRLDTLRGLSVRGGLARA